MREIAIAELRRKGFKVRLSGVADELWLLCPFCVLRGKSRDTEYKLGINIRKRVGHCFRCGWKSRNIWDDLNVASIAKTLPAEESGRRKEKVVLPSDFERIVPYSRDVWMRKAWSYVTRRGISPDQIQLQNIGISLMGRFSHRVIFPIWDENKLVGYSGRTIAGSQPPWLHSKGLQVPYYVPARVMNQNEEDVVIVVEGIFDALVVNNVIGFDAIGLLGTHLSPTKAEYLTGYKVVALWLDPDHAGRKATVEIANYLSIQEKEVIVVRSHKDPSDLSEDALYDAWSKAARWSPSEALKFKFEDQ